MGVSTEQALVDGIDWSQELLKNGGLEMARPPAPAGQARGGQNPQRQLMPPLRCPRCSSDNTKFCYYNNYSKSQPRHFCKACRRHWTEGGTLRNVPVGGGRKNKRSKPNPTTTTTTTTATANISNSNRNIVNSSTPLIHQQQQQHQRLSLPFGADNSDSSIFPEVLRQVMLRPPLFPPQPLQLSPPTNYGIGNSFTGSLPSDPLFTVPQFGAAKPTAMASSLDNVINPFSVSSTSSSLAAAAAACPFAMDTSAAGGWQGAALPLLPASGSGSGGSVDPSSGFWSGWEDDIAGLVTPQRRLPTSDDSQHP